MPSVGGARGKDGGKTRKTLEKKLNEEPVQRVRVVAAEPLRLARRRRVEIPMRHVAAARRGPRGAVQHGPSYRSREQLVAPPQHIEVDVGIQWHA